VVTASIVPVKALLKSKKRLAPVLTPQERSDFTIAMLEDVLNALKSSDMRKIVVVSSDNSIREVADAFEVSYISENKAGLNQAVEQATESFNMSSVDSILIVPCDVPLVSQEDISEITRHEHNKKSVVLSPSMDGGTNALFKSPPNLIPACFGPNSFKKHIEAACAKGIKPKIYCSQTINIDIDSEKDLETFLNIQSNTRARRFLELAALSEKILRKDKNQASSLN
jgi:2-phospho-L-lactate guanylyltransferase